MTDPQLAGVFATQWAPLVATLVRDTGDLGLAEDVAQEAFAEAARRWGPGTTPERPGAWLVTTARRKAIDEFRRQQRDTRRLRLLAQQYDRTAAQSGTDVQLAMLMGCCHPALDEPTQVALTLRYVAGLSTAQIARAYLVPEATMAKRLVRAKAKIRVAGVPFEVPEPDRMTERLGAVLAVVYLIFNEGHTASDAATLVRGDLCDEAAWLAGHLAGLVPDEPEVLGLAALIAFTDARRAARMDDAGDLVLLADQDRGLWDERKTARGHQLLERALLAGRIGPYQLQAVIAATHAVAVTFETTDWHAIVSAYRHLHALEPTPVIWLNLAVAVAMADGAEQGLELIDALGAQLDGYRYLHAARADIYRRLCREDEAVAAYRRALDLTENEPERRYLRRQIVALEG